jgi:hypothetical protein
MSIKVFIYVSEFLTITEEQMEKWRRHNIFADRGPTLRNDGPDV